MEKRAGEEGGGEEGGEKRGEGKGGEDEGRIGRRAREDLVPAGPRARRDLSRKPCDLKRQSAARG